MSNASNRQSTPNKVTSSRDDVLQFLDSLDTYSSPPPTSSTSTRPPAPNERSSLSNSTRSNTTTSHPSVAPRTTTSQPRQSLSSNQQPIAPSRTSFDSNPPSSTPTATNSSMKPGAGAATAAGTATGMATGTGTGTNANEAQSVLDFLDEITQRSSTPTASVKPPTTKPTSGGMTAGVGAAGGLSRSTSRTSIQSSTTGTNAPLPTRKSTDSVRSSTTTTAPSTRPNVGATTSAPSSSGAPEGANHGSSGSIGGGWGWSSVWTSASNVVQQASVAVQHARTVAEEQVASAQAASGGLSSLPGGLIKALGENEQAKKWSEGVKEYAKKNANLDQIKNTTLRSLTELLNAVAPPIAEHEVLKISLSHDMIGYDGVESLVYKSLTKVMEQVEGGTLIVNKGDDDSTSRTSESNDEERDLNLVDGLDPAWKLAEAKLDDLIQKTFKPSSHTSTANQDNSMTVPITTCPIYMRIQPCLSPIPSLPASLSSLSSNDSKVLFFLIILKDPTHDLKHCSLSQSMPSSWLDIPFEENEWVEDVMVDIIRRSVECIGQEYISNRMRARTLAIQKARDEAQKQLDENPPELRTSSDSARAGSGPGTGREIDAGQQAATMAGLTI